MGRNVIHERKPHEMQRLAQDEEETEWAKMIMGKISE